MKLVRIKMSISGLTEPEARGGLDDLVAEFELRPWIIKPAVAWAPESHRLIVIAHYAGESLEACRRAASDEIWDCVVACIAFSSDDVRFDIENVEAVTSAEPET